MEFREMVEDASTTFRSGRNKSHDFNIYEEAIEAFTKDGLLDKYCIRFISKLFGWLCSDGTTLTPAEIKKLDMKNIAYINSDGLKTLVFIGSENEFPTNIDIEILKLIYDDEVFYGVKNEKIVYWTKEQDKTVDKTGIICN